MSYSNRNFIIEYDFIEDFFYMDPDIKTHWIGYKELLKTRNENMDLFFNCYVPLKNPEYAKACRITSLKLKHFFLTENMKLQVFFKYQLQLYKQNHKPKTEITELLMINDKLLVNTKNIIKCLYRIQAYLSLTYLKNFKSPQKKNAYAKKD